MDPISALFLAIGAAAVALVLWRLRRRPRQALPRPEESPARLEPSSSSDPSSPHDEAPEESAALEKGLLKTRSAFFGALAGLFIRPAPIDSAALEQVEEALIRADIGGETVDRIVGALRTQMERGQLQDGQALWNAVRQEAAGILKTVESNHPPPAPKDGNSPVLILIVGVNGAGKTTTIGKLASRFQDDGATVVLAAGDTFRAAAVLQLEVWGRRVGCKVVKGKERADPASVVFDAVRTARAENADILIADTAGRLHTKAPLMEELKKVYRTAVKALDGREPDEVLLVLDATTGQNAIQQASLFKEALPISGIVLTKLDGTAKGGVVLGIVDRHRLPVRYVGIGERVEDLREFDPEQFVGALFAPPDRELAAP